MDRENAGPPDPVNTFFFRADCMDPLRSALLRHLPGLGFAQCARFSPAKGLWRVFPFLGEAAPVDGLEHRLAQTLERCVPHFWEQDPLKGKEGFDRWAGGRGLSTFALFPLPVPSRDAVILLGTGDPALFSAVDDPLLPWHIAVAVATGLMAPRNEEPCGDGPDDRYRRIFLNAPDGLFLVDPRTLTVLEGNPIFADMTGDFFREILPGSSLASLWNTTEEELRSLIDRLRQSGSSIQNQRRILRRKDGTFLHTSANLTLILSPEGEQLLVQVRDITARVEMDGLNRIFATLDHMLLAGAPVEDLLDALLEGLQSLFSFFSVHFCSPHPDGSLEILRSISRSEPFREVIRRMAPQIRWNAEQANETSVGLAIQTRTTQFMTSGESSSPLLRKVFSDFGIASTLSVPVLRGEGEVPWGTITITLTREEILSPEKVAVLEKIGSRIGLAFARHEELSRIRLQKTAMECIPVPMAMTNADGSIEWANAAFRDRVSADILRMIGNVPEYLVRGGETDELARQIWSKLESGSSYSGEIRHAGKNGTLSVSDTLITAIRGEDGAIRHLILTETDVSEKKLLEEVLKKQAWSDALTGLANRTHLEILMEDAIRRSRRSGKSLAVCFLDLDGFKPVNDRLGHAFGDRILVEVAQRLQSTVRSGDTVARMGGDEFVLLLENIDRESTCEILVARILESIARPFEAPDGLLTLTASIGVTLFPEDLSPSDVLLRHADHALYQAKETGRNCFVLFGHDPSGRTPTPTEDESEPVVSGVKEPGTMTLRLDPELDLSSARISGLTLLPVSLNTGSPPDPVPKNTPRWARYREEYSLFLRQGFRLLSELERAGFDQIMSVPIDARLLFEPGFLSDMDHLLRTTGLEHPSRVELAMEATYHMDKAGDPAGTLFRYRERGYGLCLGDCSGQSLHPMEQIRSWPLTRIRLHASLTRQISENDKSLVLFDNLVHLARVYGQEAIAAGVEDRDTFQLVVRSGTRFLQGSVLSVPLAPENVQDFLRSSTASVFSDPGLASPSPDFYLLMGTMQHQRAIRRLLEFLETGRPFPYSLEEVDSPRTCHLGKWIESHTSDHLAGSSVFRETVRLHARAHSLTGQILRLQQSGKSQEAWALVPDILACRDHILDNLRSLSSETP